MNNREITQASRASWDASAAHHRQSAAWRELVEGFARPGFSTFDATMTGLLGEVGLAGKSLVQIGCNNGRELLSAQALGAAECLGIDQSEAFLAQAHELAEIAGSQARFIGADIYDLPPDLGHYDVALVTIGVLNWMPDLAGFFAAVASLMAPGGSLLIYETHPFLEMFDPQSSTPFCVAESYFRRAPFIEESVITYGDEAVEKGPAFYWFIHKMSDILNACIGAGFRIEALEEYPHSNRETLYDIYAGQAAQIPMCFSLRARFSD